MRNTKAGKPKKDFLHCAFLKNKRRGAQMQGILRAGAGDEWNGGERHLRQTFSTVQFKKKSY